MAFMAHSDLSKRIVIFMFENSRRALWFFENRAINDGHILLGRGCGRNEANSANAIQNGQILLSHATISRFKSIC